MGKYKTPKQDHSISSGHEYDNDGGVPKAGDRVCGRITGQRWGLDGQCYKAEVIKFDPATGLVSLANIRFRNAGFIPDRAPREVPACQLSKLDPGL